MRPASLPTADATIDLAATSQTTIDVSTTDLPYEDDLVVTGRVSDDDDAPLGHAAVTLSAGDRRLAQATTTDDGTYRFKVEGEILGAGQLGLQVQAEPASSYVKASRSKPAIVRVANQQPVPVSFTIIGFLAAIAAAGGFFLARAKPWERFRRAAPAASAQAEDKGDAAPGVGGLVANKPSIVSTLRRAADDGFSGVVRDTVRGRPVPDAIVRLVLGDVERERRTTRDGSFELEALATGEWAAEVAAPGHITERFAVTIPHRGELRDVRIDLVPVREKVFQLYRRAAEPVLPEPRLWGVWSPRQIVDHVKAKRPTPALAELTDFVEELYFSNRLAAETVLPHASERVDRAIRERARRPTGVIPPDRVGARARARARDLIYVEARCRPSCWRLRSRRSRSALVLFVMRRASLRSQHNAPASVRERLGVEPEADAAGKPRRERKRPKVTSGKRPDKTKAKPERELEPEPEVAPEAAAAFKEGLAKTRGGFVAKLGKLFGKKQIDAETLEELEQVLFTADIGPRAADRISPAVTTGLTKAELESADKIWSQIRRTSHEIVAVDAKPVELGGKRPFVLLVLGVNGVGKTTTIGKLAAKWKADGKKVLFAAGDTFRAAATEQLEEWGKRADVPVVKGKPNGDPSSVIFDAIKRGVDEQFDIVICDTAGRLHSNAGLMDELKKVRRVADKAMPGSPHETWMVLDATTGQNAISQAKTFKAEMEITGIVLTKLDGSAKGGVVLGICDEMKVPVRFIGVGEKLGDLRPFDPAAFVSALYADA